MNTQQTIVRLALLCAIALLGACAGKTAKDPARMHMYEDYIAAEELPALDKINAFRFHGWNSLDNRHLIVSTSVRSAYLLSLDIACTELPFANNIRINQSISSVLSARFDSITVPGRMPQKCRIKTIHALTPEQQDAVIALRKHGPTQSSTGLMRAPVR